MPIADLAPNLGPWAVLMILAGLVALATTLLADVLLLQGRRSAALALPLALSLPGGAVLLASATAGADPVQAFAWPAGTRLILPLVAGPALALHLLFSAFVTVYRGPRVWWASAVVALIAALTVGAAVQNGLVNGELYPTLRGGGYALAACVLLVASLGGDAEGSASLEAGATAGLAFALLVAAGEVSGDALTVVMLADSGQVVVRESLDPFLTRCFTEVVEPLQPLAWAAAGAAALAPCVGAARLAWHGRVATAVAVLLALLPVPALFVFGVANYQTMYNLLSR